MALCLAPLFLYEHSDRYTSVASHGLALVKLAELCQTIVSTVVRTIFFLSEEIRSLLAISSVDAHTHTQPRCHPPAGTPHTSELSTPAASFLGFVVLDNHVDYCFVEDNGARKDQRQGKPK